MRNILALIGLLVIGFLGLGWYMGWYKLSVSRGSEGKLHIATDVDTKKVGNDSSELWKNATTVVGSHLDKDAKTPNGAPGGTPGPVVPPQGTVSTPPIPFVPVAPVAPEAPPTLPVVPVSPGPQTPPRAPIVLVPPK